ncbi:low-density lipoprotein receptor-related protein 4-like [Bombyx mandarina]|uniref:Low-density lipoprotein receptor-related protein 4-like n=1 Tax=Bombyx mandarina TaxID=7092 RepID=A0A6J2JG58_BOMMA|nr:low-density lipoprotein receptor-related protein 4-like [Bombyx mandarina]XP_028028556.1 low-density lipoprotein receptor-related protein 4-like [Bombyx mandarina]XP_028028557.1 low-density lipoprotein receptor-related protein 4-like [Bombyx mandarina]XP_028028558.1 low-density lipoprotein receptor-related protein 4-like [Bombyx mandarina]
MSIRFTSKLHHGAFAAMPAPIVVYIISFFFFWLYVLADEPIGQNGPQATNNSVDAPDPRSPLGRVPPYQPPPAGMGVGPNPMNSPGFWPHGIYTRVEGWHHRPSLQKAIDVIHTDPDDGPLNEGTEDDAGCITPCLKINFSCQISCTCIPMEKRCDGIADCAEAEDEAGCARSCDEHENRTICHSTNVCIALEWLCDGDNDCGDFSDEINCGAPTNCTADQFQCSNGLCIHKGWVCDGDNDCRDNSDETNCTKGRCRENQFTCAVGECISQHWRCDHEPDCPDSSDEADCPVELMRCAEIDFECKNTKCVPKDFQCDGDNDCGDWTDEDSCPMVPGSCNAGEFKCNDGKCIPERWRCDNERDCADGGDELNCKPNSIRNCSLDEYTCADRRCVLKTWLCDGVRDCTNGEDEMNCEVSCEEDQYTCRPQEHLMSNAFRNCVNRKHVCDGMKDCPRGDDEERCPLKRKCSAEEKCEKLCITTYDGHAACACPMGFLLAEDKYSCRDIDECMYEQDPVCSQTCSNTVGSFRCGCMTGYILRPDERSCKPTGESPTLLFSNRIGIRQVWLTGDNYMSVVKGLHNAVALDYHYEKKLVFWSENNLRVIRVAQMNTKNMSDVIRWGLETPAGVAVDWIHDLLFWTDSGTRRVEVATLDGSKRAVLVANDLDKPRAIAVHPGDALVFWTDWGPNPKIERADMDGDKRKTVIYDEIFWPNGLTIDYTESKIYWADAKHHVIERAAFDGRDRRKVTTKGLPHPFALTLFDDAIYWTDWHTKSISTVNKNTGMGIQTVHAGLNVPMDIHSYHPLRQLRTYKNKCGKSNGGCSHLCLPNAYGFSCRCPVGFNLNSDGRSCEETPEKLLLYARRKDLRLKQLESKKPIDSLDMVIPVETIKSAVALDWDQKSNSIFWTDVEKDTINRAYLNGSHQTTIVDSNLIWPAGLAFDWITDKIYWTDGGTNRIEVSKSDGSMRTLLAWDHIDKPRDIVVNPEGGVMYWSDWGASPCIERADMDGGNRKKLIFGQMTWPNGLALDLVHNRIYWTDGGNKTIEYANLDGTGRTKLIENLPHPFGLDLYGDEVFWTDWDTQSIQAANKDTGAKRRTLGSGVAGLMDVRVFHKERTSGFNRCGKNNGGCSHLCLLKPGGRSCACPIGIKLNKDGKTCADGPINYLIFAHRVDIRVISLDVPYLIDVVLPLPPLKNALGVDVDHSTGLIYWTDTGQRKIQRATRLGTHVETVIGNGLHTADGIVIDSTGRKIYWTDGGRNSIEVAELDGRNRKVLVWTGLDSPRAIALHYEYGYMFWSDWGTSAKIERADMDGNNRRVIVDNKIKWPNGLAIDRIEGRLYWNDAKILTIESSDFDGHDRRTVLSNVPYPYGIVIVGQHIYWTDWKTKALHRADKTNASDPIVIRKNLEGLMDIRAIQSERVLENACGTDNGGCSHLCLRSPLGFTCACPTGMPFEKSTTDQTPKKCKSHPEEFLIFATRGSITYISLESPEQWDVTLPVKEVKNTIAVDYHWDLKMIFYTDLDLNVIRSINMTNMSESKTIISQKLETPNGLGVDWIANNIYWTDNEHKVIEVARLDGSSRKVLITGLTEPRALALFPAKGYLYWSDWGEHPYIERSYLDGSQRQIIVQVDLGFPNGLTIDYKERRLYWTDALKDRIDTSDLNGQHRVQLVPDAKNPFGMTQFKDYIYWTDWYKKSIIRADKRTGKNITLIRTNLEMAMEIKAVSADRQHGWNPCKESNGGCSHLCLFRGHEYICACPDDPDHVECSTVPKFLIENILPAHYPPYYDYSDIEFKKTVRPPPTPSPDYFGRCMMAGGIILISILAFLFVTIYCVKMLRNYRDTELKDEEFSNSTGHISFHNPNYSCATGGPGGNGPDHIERRQNRFQGIFKYDKQQERVTNVYYPEGTSLLPTPTPPPPQRQALTTTKRPPTHDDFEPVTLHSYA